jgi:hypothetical protein
MFVEKSKIPTEHILRNHPLKCENCNWIGTYEEAAIRFDREVQLGGGKTFSIGDWGNPICVICGTPIWSSKLMPTETNPDATCNCRDAE